LEIKHQQTHQSKQRFPRSAFDKFPLYQTKFNNMQSNYDPKKYMASFLDHHYKGHSIQIQHGCCRKCLKHGKPVIHNLATQPWSSLFADGIINPYQTASVFFPGSQFHMAHFKKPILDLSAPELPCKYPATCELTCLMCNKYIDGPGIELKDWPGFKVHAQCTTKCQYTACQTRLPDFPAYIHYQRSQFLCEEHHLTRGFQCMSLGSVNPTTPVSNPRHVHRISAVTPKLLSQAVKEIKEKMETPKPKSILLRTSTTTKEPTTPRKEDMQIEQRPVTPQPTQIKKTVTFKKHPGRAKADKFNGDKSKSITDFFRSPMMSPAKAIKQPPPVPEEPPRRFIRDKQGVIYAYWKGDAAHCIDTDTVLFRSSHFSGKRVYAPKCKLDFTPPQRFTPIDEDPTTTGAPSGAK
jgi:hypothetical protein